MRRSGPIGRGLRRCTAVLLALAMTVMLAACAGNPKDDAPAKESTTTVSPVPTEKQENAVPTPGTDEREQKENGKTPDDNGQGSGVTEKLTAGSNAAPEKKAMDETMREAYANFSYRLFKACAQGESGNCVISPFSVYTALAMLANGAKGNTATQMDSVLGLTPETRNRYLAGWISSLTGQKDVSFTCADSVWISKLFRTAVPDPFLATCADYYMAEVYAAEMNDGTVDDVNAWVNKNTKGMIEKIIDKGDLAPDTSGILMNAITLDAAWEIPFLQENTLTAADFTKEDGTTAKVDLLRGEADRCYLENDTFIGCTKSYKGGKYRFVALLPKEGITLDAAVAALDGKTVDGLFAGAAADEVNLLIPKINDAYGKDLCDVLSELGMPDAFGATADFTGLITTGESYVDSVVHKTFLSLDNQGTRAAAVTYISVRTLSISRLHTIRLDRPFIYMIVDENNLPVFIGTFQ